MNLTAKTITGTQKIAMIIAPTSSQNGGIATAISR